MRKKQRDPLEAGRIVKQIAPVLGITVDKLMTMISEKVHCGKDSIRQYFYEGKPWPFKDMGYDDCFEMAYSILGEQRRKGKLTEQDEKKRLKEVKRILNIAFMDLDTLTVHGKKSPDTGTNRIEEQIKWIMRDINNLDIETLYVLNRYFDAFSSITETDLKWIDFLDCLGHVKWLITLDKFKRKLLKEEYSVSCGLILENMNSKDFQQWLELLSRRSYRDTTRKTDSNKLKFSIEKKIRAYANDCGLGIISLQNFIQYLINEHQGSFFDIEQKYWKIFLLIKYWVSHFEGVPEIAIYIEPPQTEEERQPKS